jgi:uncharacterized circularly permuted ATP-grasp superfamily protein
VDERFILSCNGKQVPLTRTETSGEYVGGVRFKAWNPPSALHPTVRAQTPLIFDVYDTWTGRSLGGLTHHVSHPGGRNYERFPVNANEAEARRRARFFPFGHTPGDMPVPVAVPGKEHPRTLFSEAEFAEVTAALAQRATLLEAILVDMYGPQIALASGIIPPALVYPDPAYLRPCRREKPGRQLHLYAADLFRDPDGVWRVLADRTAEPGGLAHALENRRMMARVLPELFRQADIAPLRPFFDAMQDSLQRLAPAGNPGLALLTPGHTDPGWFEHVILARELGCALVEDGDLTVRDGAVWVKTLRGLSPVHVLLRHQKGSSMDPLDLNEYAGSGIPGLFCAMRDGAVTVLNAPGAGFAQSPGLMPFLPVLARHFLQAELALPSIETIWLGDAAAQARVRGNSEHWRILPTHGGIGDLAKSMAEKPWGFVAMLPAKPSVAPCLGAGDVLEPYGIIVRLFLLWDGQGWRPLPGGVARVADPGLRIAKDVWVLTEEGADIVGPGNLPVPAMPIRRMAGDLPSRVADNFFWLGRYLERLENAARLTRAMLARLGRAALTPRDMPDFVALAACLAEAGMLNPDIGAGAGPAVLADQLRRALAGRPADRPGANAGRYAARPAQR